MKRITTSQSIHLKLKTNKYVIVPKKELIIPKYLNMHRKRFKKDWNELGKDNFLKNGSSFRYRRFQYFYFLPESGKIVAYAPTPYYQPAEINKYAGDIDQNLTR